MIRSYRTQQILNYFPPEDVRMRESPVSIDNQFLDIQAQEMDDLELKLSREVRSRFLATCPTGIDSGGLYQAVKLPSGYTLPPEGTDPIVEGLRSGIWTRLVKYDDRLPVPARVSLDPSRTSVTVSNPLIMDVIGIGDSLARFWDVKNVTPGLLALPNHLTFYVEGLNASSAPLDVFIVGSKYPLSPWPNEAVNSHEELTTITDGTLATKFAWARVDSITVKNLPTGARLRCWFMEFDMPVVPDPVRWYTDPGYRDVLFQRYWQLDKANGFLTEQFLANNFIGLSYIQSYSAPGVLDIAVEPNTWGMYSVSSGNLMYTDRREPWPSHLDQTGITVEPLYGIQVYYDQARPGPTRYATISPYPYEGATNCLQFRYIVQYPDGSLFILNRDRSLSPYVASQGWSKGVPGEVGMPLLSPGTYVFTIECMAISGAISKDVFPYANLAFSPLVTLDVSSLVAGAQGVCFDHLGRLWLWDGAAAIPVKVSYDAFVVDRSHNMIFVTDAFDSVRLS